MMPTDQFRAFEDYVAVDISWCPEIPAHWKTAPLRIIFDESRRKNRDRRNQDYLSLMAGVGVIPYAEKGDIGNKKPDDLANCKIVDPDDFVLNSMNFGIGSFGRSKYHGVCSSVYVILKARDVSQLSYYERVFQHPQFQRFSQSLGNGILAHRCAIGWEELKNAHFPVPPAEEITAISAFLDNKCAKIDGALKIKEDQIVLLCERRQIIIQDAVTRGLNPAAPMKDSGIDWIGQVPAHWKTSKLRYIGTFQNGISEGAEYFGSGFPFVTYGDVYNYSVLQKAPSGLAKSSTLDREKYSIQKNDVLFTRTSEVADEIGIASTCMETIDEATFSGFLIRMRPSSDVLLNVFSKFLFRSNYVRNFFAREVNIVTRASLGQELLKNLPIFVPEKEEQENIASFLELETLKIEDAIAIKERQIVALKEYKTSLINAAVTGKIKVI